ncbi:MAG: RsmD family RNA methyltransferase [Deltaproteobacteria bacterium]|nr:RsmD family RNA methyltransferase [Deltaproteobacteria bacterium]
MRIFGGRWAGLQLLSPGERVRPTMEPLRDACMRRLGDALVGARVLDLFSGTGALGLEALSRGAASVDFVENGTSAIHSLKANVAKVKARERTRIFLKDAIPFVERLAAGAYDIAFADPPYGSKKLDRVVARWRVVPFAPVLVVEHAADHPFDAPLGGVTIRVDDSVVTILRAAPGQSLSPGTSPSK